MTPPRLILLSIAATVLAGPALAAQVSGPDAEVTATVDAALGAATTGDVRKLADQYAPDCVFVDEFAPFLWTGPGAIQAYFMAGGRTYAETQHKADKARFGPASFVYVAADRAFVVEPVNGSATVRGRPYSQSGAFAFTLARTDGRWKITSQTWTKSHENMNPYAD
ncbi:MAG TPA: nuclear transport factor 2 family protein [Caulobacteraceae bacterium]|nr:nuclear transport factor 2 family protein [Caulobacteraceae bacterium]